MPRPPKTRNATAESPPSSPEKQEQQPQADVSSPATDTPTPEISTPNNPGTSLRETVQPPVPRHRAYTDASNDEGRRSPQFFKWITEVFQNPDWANRITLYVYRLWPVINKPRPVYIAVLSEPLTSEQDVLNRWGSGQYKIIVSYSPGGKRKAESLCDCLIRTVMDMRSFPPVIEDTSWVVREDPSNKSYIAFMQQTPGQKPGEEEENMAVASELAGALRDVVTQQRQPSSGGGKEAVEVVASAARLAQQMVSEAAGQLQSSQNPANIANIIETLSRVQRDNAATGGETTKAMLEELRASRQQVDEANRRAFELMMQQQASKVDTLAETVQSLARMMNTPPPAPPPTPPPPPPPSIRTQLEELRALKDLMSDITGSPATAGDDEEDSPRGGKAWWENPVIMGAVQAGLHVVGNITNAYLASKGVTPPPAPSAPQPNVPVPVPTPAMPQPKEDPMLGIGAFVRTIEAPLIQHMMNGMSGGDFALWFLEGYGDGNYKQLQSVGVDMIVSALTTHSEQLRNIHTMSPAAFREFVVAFLEGPKEEEEPEIPVPVAAVPFTAPASPAKKP